MTKTAVKKEERKITEKTVIKAPKVNSKVMADGGFEVVDNTRDQARAAPRGGFAARGA